jgi:hypothetical protein
LPAGRPLGPGRPAGNSQGRVPEPMVGAKKAFDAGDEKALSDGLGQLKPDFIKTLFLFGDFPQ